ncbi:MULTISPECIES: hypothetical protein [unclassified Moraxella]|uniref:hypothetical protein n=1 Tax=unclassified Moraxella TaxID=2685852 RepID=UPI003AF4ABAB
MREVYHVPPLVLDYDMYDSFWELLSILTFPINQQVEVIGGLPNAKLSPHPYITNAFLFKEALDSYSKVWIEEFDELYDVEKGCVIEIYQQFIDTLKAMDESDCYSISEFYNHHWQKLRQLSPMILQIVGLSIISFEDISKPVDWSGLVRVFINGDGNIQVD